ncbi:MAG: hypothetical protein L0H75_08705, partial [Nitrosospira sp.]|nr:hypothetical protein [Nitrosospira sp.]
MNLPPISTASSNPPPTEAARGADSADTQAFSSVMVQQQGQAHRQEMATLSDTAVVDNAATDTDQHDSLIPDETLALLATGAALSLTTSARTVTVSKPGVDTSRTIMRGSFTHEARTTAQTRAGIEDRSLLVSGKALSGAAVGLEASDHVVDSAPKPHQIKQAGQAITQQASDAALARINARIADTPATADSRSINALGAHPTQPSRPPRFDPLQVVPQQAPTTDRSALQGVSTMLTHAGPSPATAKPERQPTITMAAAQ